MDNWIEVLTTSQTQGVEFQAHSEWYLCVETYTADVVLESKAPGGTWIALETYDGVGKWRVHSAPGDLFRLTTSSAGSRVWIQQ